MFRFTPVRGRFTIPLSPSPSDESFWVSSRYTPVPNFLSVICLGISPKRSFTFLPPFIGRELSTISGTPKFCLLYNPPPDIPFSSLYTQPGRVPPLHLSLNCVLPVTCLEFKPRVNKRSVVVSRKSVSYAKSWFRLILLRCETDRGEILNPQRLHYRHSPPTSEIPH